MNPIGQRLTDLARTEGRRWYDPKTRLCVGARDTLWYAIALLHSPEAEERALGDALLGTAQSADGTHTPATMLAILLAIPDRISPVTAAHLEAEVRKSLPEAEPGLRLTLYWAYLRLFVAEKFSGPARCGGRWSR